MVGLLLCSLPLKVMSSSQRSPAGHPGVTLGWCDRGLNTENCPTSLSRRNTKPLTSICCCRVFLWADTADKAVPKEDMGGVLWGSGANGHFLLVPGGVLVPLQLDDVPTHGALLSSGTCSAVVGQCIKICTLLGVHAKALGRCRRHLPKEHVYAERSKLCCVRACMLVDLDAYEGVRAAEN
jgi:hypothetical protein